MKEKVCIVGVCDKWRELLYQELIEDGKEVLFYIDSFSKHSKIPTIKPDEVKDKLQNGEVTFLFTYPTVGGRKAVLDILKSQLGEVLICDYKYTYTKYKNVFKRVLKNGGDWWLNSDYNKQKALDTIELLADEKSKNIFKSWLTFRESFDINMIPDPEENQYYPGDIQLENYLPKEVSFLDFGAYVGDTFEFFYSKIINLGKKIVYYAGFEPFERNYKSLLENLKKYEDVSMHLLPLAAGSKSELICFEEKSADTQFSKSSNYYNHDSIPIFTVVPDEIFKNIKFNLIKIDTEGSELEILKGLKNIIKENKPVMMISLYHKAEDFYEIPWYIKQIFPDSAFYIRTHGTFFMETVLYVVPN
jgi:FkbM family methyltransferase